MNIKRLDVVAFLLFISDMNLHVVLGKKINQTQGFLEDGTRIPLSVVSVPANIISQVKTTEKDGYDALQLGIEVKKKANKPLAGHTKKAGLEQAPRFFREARVVKAEDIADASAGMAVAVSEVLKPGDIIDITGTSKGKGYAGVVKKWHFRGGPKTHGQSDRHRAPGSIGQSTTPGRVYKGKKMSGRMGAEQVTIKNLVVIDVTENEILVKGLIPGPKGQYVVITKRGEVKNFVPLFKKVEETPEVAEEQIEEVAAEAVETPAVEEVKEEAVANEAEPVTEEKKEETKETEEKGA